MLDEVLKVTYPGSTTKIEIDDLKILGKLGDTNSGHIVPILINFITEEDAKLGLKRREEETLSEKRA